MGLSHLGFADNGSISGFFNNGVTAAIDGFPAGALSGLGSGLSNHNTGFSGIFDIDKLASS